MQLAPVMMNFRYGTTFGGEVPEAYETLLLDALIGDPTLFARHDFVEASWALISPVHEAWAAQKATEIPTYEAGEWGPPEARRPDRTPMVSAGGRYEGQSVAVRELHGRRDRLRRRAGRGARGVRALVRTSGVRPIVVTLGDASRTGPNRSAIARSSRRAACRRYLNNAVASLRLSSLPAIGWWRDAVDRGPAWSSRRWWTACARRRGSRDGLAHGAASCRRGRR